MDDTKAVLEKIFSLKEKLEKTSQENNSLESEVASATKKLEQLNEENFSLKDQLANFGGRNGENGITSFEAELAFLDAERRDAEKRIEELQEEILRCSSSVIDLNLKTKNISRQKTDLIMKFERWRLENTSLADEMQKNLNLLQVENEEIAGAEIKKKSLIEELNSLEGQEKELGDLYQAIREVFLVSRGQLLRE